jgi:diguanylate cyclase (GGDEF)-like protein
MGISVQALLLDLDNFKQINDRYGHGVGDAVLVAVTQMIQQTVRQTDYVARVGGDEFMVLLLDSREGDAVKVADKIRIAVAQTSAGVSFGDIVKTTCSIGIVPLGDKPVLVDELLQKLHLSLHLCKNKGKNLIAYQGEQVKIDIEDSDATSELKRILTAGEKFYAASQPIFDLRNMAKVGFELLTRLDYDEYSSPDEFLRFARNANLLGIVDYACMKTCLKALKDVPVIKRIYINIFPSTLAEVPVDRLLRDFEFAGKNISFCIEINEQQILGDPLYLIPSIMRLKNAGIMIALDDYGFGYSSVETLVLLEPDIVKIDRKIVNGISKDARKFNSLKRLLRVIESCKASVIAEGIETKEDLEVLRNLGVTFGQGFFMGKPETPPHLI